MKFNKLYTYIVIVALSVTGCSDMFSPELDNNTGEEITKVNPYSVMGFLNAGYITLPTSYDFSECATDDAVINDPNSSYLVMASGAWSPTFDPTSIWSTSYTSITNVNKFLTYMPGQVISWYNAVDDSLYKKRMIAEAHGLRAYHHFQLLKYYGGESVTGKMLGVPYLKNVISIDPANWANVVRPEYKETVDSIVSDLNYAIKNLPEEYTGTDRVLGVKNKNRMTSWIATAVKAQLYLHVSSPKYNGGEYNVAYCDSALKYSSMLINRIGGIAALSGVLKNNLFYTSDENQNAPEIIWRMNPTPEATDGGSMALTIEANNYPPSRSGLGKVNPTQDFVDAFPVITGYPITDSKALYNPNTPYAKRDLRLDMYVLRDGGFLNDGNPINTSKESAADGIENKGATRTGYYLKKLLRPDFSITNPVAGKKTIRPLIRYTEMFLIFAEAATAAHGGDWKGSYSYSARDIVKAIRKRAGITLRDVYASNVPVSEMMGLVRNERRIELAFEGFRFWDLRRWGLETNVTLHKAKILTTGGAPEYLTIDDEHRSFNTFKYFAPIPNSEILKCPKLEQNGSGF